MEERLFFDSEILANITLDDCIDMYRRKGFCAVCNDGKLLYFEREPKAQDSTKLIWLTRAI